jgi:predicted phage gp36 major capsid-like protein
VIWIPKSSLNPKISTDTGRVISITPVSKNVSFPIPDNLDPDLKGTGETNLINEKKFKPKTSTDSGREISRKQLEKNAHDSIRENLDSDSHLTQ